MFRINFCVVKLWAKALMDIFSIFPGLKAGEIASRISGFLAASFSTQGRRI
jgi:hypothetical protein